MQQAAPRGSYRELRGLKILRSMHRVRAPLRGPDPGESPRTLTGADLERLAGGLSLS